MRKLVSKFQRNLKAKKIRQPVLKHRFFKMLAILILLMLSSVSSEINSASAVATNSQICEWDNEAATVWQEVICMEMPDDTNSAQTNEPESLTPDTTNSLESATGAPPTVPWSIQVGGTGTEIHDVTTDSNGYVYVTGAISSLSDSDAFVAKLDGNGGMLWSYPFTGMAYDEGKAISLDTSGSVFITGSVRSASNPNTDDILLARLNNSGQLIWIKTVGNATQYDVGMDITVEGSGNIYITGGSFGSWGSPMRPYTSGQYDAFVAMFEPVNGTQVWNTFLGENRNGFGMGITADSTGKVYVTGVNFVPGTSSNIFVSELTSIGDLLWYADVGSAGVNDSGRDIVLDGNGNVYVAGDSWGAWGTPLSCYSGNTDAVVLKFNNSGDMQWSAFVGGSGHDLGYGIDMDSTGNLFISGYSTSTWGSPFESGSGSPQQVFTAKMDSNGNLLWNTFIKGETWYQSYGHLNRIAEWYGSMYIVGNVGIFEESNTFVTKIIDSPEYISSGTNIVQAVREKVGQQGYCGNLYNSPDGLITLPPGRQAFERFANLASNARYEIDFVTMGWDEDENPSNIDSPGEFFLQGIQELYNDFQQNPGNYPSGMKVRILLGLKSYKDSDDQRLNVLNDLDFLDIPRLGTNWSVEVAYHHHISGEHSHVKMLIVDGKHVITGGYNMHYNYLEDDPVHDMGIQISGPIVFDSLLTFDRLWMEAHLCTNDDCTQETTITSISHDLAVLNPPVMGNDVVFSLFRDRYEKTADEAIAAAIGAATSEVDIIQNRFLNTKWSNFQYVTAILNAIENENVSVNLLVSSGNGDIEGDFDNRINLWGICQLHDQIRDRNPLYLPRFDARFASNTNPIHTKALSIDHSFVIVGSQNFDSSAWGNYLVSLAEYSLGSDSDQAADSFETKFWAEWNDDEATSPSCLDDGITGTALQNAIDQASPGTSMFLPAGVYTGSVIINKPLVLIGAGASQTIFQPQGNQPAFRITSSDVTIMNMKISGGNGYGIELIDSSPSSLKNIRVNQVVFENNAQGGILAQGLISGSPMNYAIENNTFIGGASGVSINMIGTQADASIIRNNIFSGQSNAPIHILSTDDSHVEYSYNLFDDCGSGTCAANWKQGNLSLLSNSHDNLFDMNPLFASPENGAYQLSTGSPAIDAGDPSLYHDLFHDGDNDGMVRIDIGAFEYAYSPVANIAPVVNAGNDQTIDLGNSLTVNATYTDADNSENHSARIDWGDGTIEDVPVSMTGSGAGTVSGEHTYTSAGNYTVEICVTDLYGGVGCDTMTVEVVAPPSDLIFSDGFESGNFSAWYWADTDGGDLSTTAQSAAVGSKGVQAVIDDAVELVMYDHTPNDEKHFSVRFYFNPKSVHIPYKSVPYDQGFYLFAGEDSTSWVFCLYVEQQGIYYTLALCGKDDAGSWTQSTPVLVANEWQAVEIEWKAASAPGVNDGYLKLWVNDILVKSVENIDNDTRSIAETSFGVMDVDTGTSGTVYFDAFESHQGSHIGLDPNGPAMNPPPQPGDLIFNDDFESGNLSAWISAVTDSGDLSVSALAAHQSNYGLQALLDDQISLRAIDGSPLDETHYRARFYFNPNSLAMTSGKAHYIFDGMYLRTNDAVARTELIRENGVYKLRAQVMKDNYVYLASSKFTISNDWHVVEIEWQASSAPGANNGFLTLWIDGALMGTISGVDNDTHTLGESRLGATLGVDTGTAGSMLFDKFESRRNTYIGP